MTISVVTVTTIAMPAATRTPTMMAGSAAGSASFRMRPAAKAQHAADLDQPGIDRPDGGDGDDQDRPEARERRHRRAHVPAEAEDQQRERNEGHRGHGPQRVDREGRRALERREQPEQRAERHPRRRGDGEPEERGGERLERLLQQGAVGQRREPRPDDPSGPREAVVLEDARPAAQLPQHDERHREDEPSAHPLPPWGEGQGEGAPTRHLTPALP